MSGVSKGEWDWRKHFRHRKPLDPMFPGRKKQHMFGYWEKADALESCE